jgi:hypothetical protein
MFADFRIKERKYLINALSITPDILKNSASESGISEIGRSHVST